MRGVGAKSAPRTADVACSATVTPQPGPIIIMRKTRTGQCRRDRQQERCMQGIRNNSELAHPDMAEAEAAVALARRRFRRVLASWASDLLQLRRAGLLAPAWRADLADVVVAAGAVAPSQRRAA
jgi:hypothetical protein